MNIPDAIGQTVCFAIQTCGLLAGFLTHNYVLVIWCSGWQFYALYKLLRALGDYNEIKGAK